MLGTHICYEDASLRMLSGCNRRLIKNSRVYVALLVHIHEIRILHHMHLSVRQPHAACVGLGHLMTTWQRWCRAPCVDVCYACTLCFTPALPEVCERVGRGTVPQVVGIPHVMGGRGRGIGWFGAIPFSEEPTSCFLFVSHTCSFANG